MTSPSSKAGTGARLRKNRNVFSVKPAPKESMSKRAFGGATTSAPPPDDLQEIVDWFLDQEAARERFRWALRDSLDELMDGQRTGRWCYQHLTKTEKTYLGTAIEMNFTREFDLADGHHLDWLVAGQDLDCKFSKDFGGWEIPMEMYRCADHGEQSGIADHPALLLWFNDDLSQWAAGVVRITDERLAFRRTGGRAYNRDNKRKLGPSGIEAIHWLWGSLQDDLPENLILHMDSELRERLFAPNLSGQRRINILLEEYQHRIISRATIFTVAQQDDSMKRARDARLPKHLGKKGIMVLGHQEADPQIAESLGLPIPAKGEFVSCRMASVSADDGRPKVWIDDAYWAVAGPDDAAEQGPKRPKGTLSPEPQ